MIVTGMPGSRRSITKDPLIRFLVTGGRHVHSVAGDGNCMFHSLSHQLFGTPERHFVVRSLLVRFESKNKRPFHKY